MHRILVIASVFYAVLAFVDGISALILDVDHSPEFMTYCLLFWLAAKLEQRP